MLVLFPDYYDGHSLVLNPGFLFWILSHNFVEKSDFSSKPMRQNLERNTKVWPSTADFFVFVFRRTAKQATCCSSECS